MKKETKLQELERRIAALEKKGEGWITTPNHIIPARPQGRYCERCGVWVPSIGFHSCGGWTGNPNVILC